MTPSGPPPAEPLTLWSIGHSNQSLASFLELLRAHELERVVDVRRYPVSRRHPHFARDSLALALPRAGIRYLHLADLGGHCEAAPSSPHIALPPGPFRGYADHMGTPAFEAALRQLVALLRERRTAVMCAEARWSDCHRRLLCDRLVSEGAEVRHLRAGAAPELHGRSPEARLEGGRLVYRAVRERGLFD